MTSLFASLHWYHYHHRHHHHHHWKSIKLFCLFSGIESHGSTSTEFWNHFMINKLLNYFTVKTAMCLLDLVTDTMEWYKFYSIKLITQLRFSNIYLSHFKISIWQFWKGEVEQNLAQSVFQHLLKTKQRHKNNVLFCFLYPIQRNLRIICSSVSLILNEGLPIDLLLQLYNFLLNNKK